MLLHLMEKALKGDARSLDRFRGRDTLGGAVGIGATGRREGPWSVSAHQRDRLHGWGDWTRTLMCGEKIHLFDKSCSLGFSQLGGDGRARWENDLFCWGWTVSSHCVGEKIQEL
jgi:hypothetical protein